MVMILIPEICTQIAVSRIAINVAGCSGRRGSETSDVYQLRYIGMISRNYTTCVLFEDFFEGVILILLLYGQLINKGTTLKLIYEDSYVTVQSV